MNKRASGMYKQSTNRYEDFVALHQNVMNNVHNNAIFLIWHRYFLWTFEQVLRKECNFDRAFVWWDETKDAGNFASSDIFTSPYFGALPALKNGNPVCITNGEFGGLSAHIGPGTLETTHCLSRGVTEANTAQCNTNFVSYCQQRAAYADFETCLEYG
jgi:tyrosinase